MGSLVITDIANLRLLKVLERAGIPDPVLKMGLQSDVMLGGPEETRQAARQLIARNEWRLVPQVFHRKNLGLLRAINCGAITLAFPAGPTRLMFGVYLGEHYVIDVVESEFVLLNSKRAIVLPPSPHPKGSN